MTLADAITTLKDNAVGSNQYELLQNWEQVEEAIQFEVLAINERTRELESLAEMVRDKIEESE